MPCLMNELKGGRAGAAGPWEASRGEKCPGSGGRTESHLVVGPGDRLSVGVSTAWGGHSPRPPDARGGEGVGLGFCSVHFSWWTTPQSGTWTVRLREAT